MLENPPLMIAVKPNCWLVSHDIRDELYDILCVFFKRCAHAARPVWPNLVAVDVVTGEHNKVSVTIFVDRSHHCVAVVKRNVHVWQQQRFSDPVKLDHFFWRLVARFEINNVCIDMNSGPSQILAL